VSHTAITWCWWTVFKQQYNQRCKKSPSLSFNINVSSQNDVNYAATQM